MCCSILSDHSRVSKIGLPLRIDLFFWTTSLIADHVEPQVYVHFYTSCLHKGFHRRNIRWHRHSRSYLWCSHILSSPACIQPLARIHLCLKTKDEGHYSTSTLFGHIRASERGKYAMTLHCRAGQRKKVEKQNGRTEQSQLGFISSFKLRPSASDFFDTQKSISVVSLMFLCDWCYANISPRDVFQTLQAKFRT